MFKLPFGTLPSHWGTAGRTREIMQAEYELTGYELEKRLLEIGKDDHDETHYQKKVLDLELKHGKIQKKAYDRALAETIQHPIMKALALVELDYREGLIGELEYSKQVATLNDEPWVTVLNMEFGGAKALEGSFELDWNQQFVAKLEAEGYLGLTPDAVVNMWFMEVCRNVALEEFDGTGDFTADSEANLEAFKRWGKDSLPEGRKGHK